MPQKTEAAAPDKSQPQGRSRTPPGKPAHSQQQHDHRLGQEPEPEAALFSEAERSAVADVVGALEAAVAAGQIRFYGSGL